MEEYRLRPAQKEDMAEVLALYSHYVLHTTASFEFEVPSIEEFLARYDQFSAFYPWLVCTDRGGAILGYVYASRFGERQGYNWVASASVYLHKAACGRGMGRRLYNALFALLRAQGVRGVYAGVSCPNPASEAFHEHMGFVLEGWLREIGYKFGKNIGVKYYAKALLPTVENPPLPVPWRDLPAETVVALLNQ